MTAGLAEPAKAAYNHPMTAPPTTATLLQQGLFHHQRGELAQAMDRYTDVLRVDPQHADALYYVAVVACQEGQYSQGAELAKRAIDKGVAFVPGAPFYANNPDTATLRLSFATADVAKIEEGVARLGQAL